MKHLQARLSEKQNSQFDRLRNKSDMGREEYALALIEYAIQHNIVFEQEIRASVVPMPQKKEMAMAL